MSNRLFAAIRGIVYASVFVALWTWVVLTVRPLDQWIAIEFPAWLQLPGVLVAGLGLALALSCVAVFALKGKGTPAPFDAPREFVAVGPYRYVRNPMYLGAIFTLLGVSLALRSPSTLGVAVGFWLLAHSFVVLYEEPDLERRFGESYRRYLRRVGRWVPRSGTSDP
jgi:protein-S-isoprenylcysteine O-methyltransferase Ste14